MKLERKKRLGVLLWGTSALSTVVAIAALVPIANAQLGPPNISLPVAVSSPSDLDVMNELRYDPFANTLDHSRATGNRVGGAAVGTPDIAYGSTDPVDGSLLPGGARRQVPVVSPRGGVGPRVAADPLGSVLFVGWVSGKPPYAVIRQSDGKEGVYGIGDVINGQKIMAITATGLVFVGGHSLALTPVPVAATNGAPFAMAGPAAQLLGGAGALGGGGVPTASGVLSRSLTAPGGTSFVSPSTLPAGGPDAENVGRMPLSPSVPGSFTSPATPVPGGR